MIKNPRKLISGLLTGVTVGTLLGVFIWLSLSIIIGVIISVKISSVSRWIEAVVSGAITGALTIMIVTIANMIAGEEQITRGAEEFGMILMVLGGGVFGVDYWSNNWGNYLENICDAARAISVGVKPACVCE